MRNDHNMDVIARKRFRKRVCRSEKKKLRRREAFPPDSVRPYRSRILDLFYKGERGGMQLRGLPEKTFLAPSTFSISRNTKRCIDFFQDIIRYARTARRPKIVLDQRSVTYLGLGADSVLGILLTEIKQELRYTHGASIKGFKPKSKTIQRVMDEVGSVRALFMDVEQDIRVSFTSKTKVFRHRHRPSDEGQSTRIIHPAASVIKDFADHLNSCLLQVGSQLSVDGRDNICHYAAEIIDNVQEHSGLGEWAFVGYSDINSSNPIYRCVIFCFGKTIAETFLELPGNSYPRRVIDPYIVRHRGGGLFRTGWGEEDLITLIAMQGDVSSKSVNEYSDRGQGTVELIQFFQDVSGECGLRNYAAPELVSGTGEAGVEKVSAEMNIISGSTRIRFDGEYKMQFREELNRDVIAFNKTNDLFERPDSKAIISLEESRFPGTLVTIEIPLVGTLTSDLGDYS